METYNQTRSAKLSCALTGVIVQLLITPILFYQWVISPWLGHHCRFQPTCSHYAISALREHGPIQGSYLSIRRLSKCHPWHRGGCDPVPLKSTLKQKDGL